MSESYRWSATARVVVFTASDLLIGKQAQKASFVNRQNRKVGVIN